MTNLDAFNEAKSRKTQKNKEHTRYRTLEPNYSGHCDHCSQSPTVADTDLCGACYFGEADCIDPNNW